MDRRRRFAAAAAIVTTVAIVMSLAAAPVLAADRTVTIEGFAFSPKTVTVNVGDSVTWTNNDGTAHTATGSGFDTGDIAGGASKTVTFQSAGSFAYMCAIHPTMTGTVVVRSTAAGGATTPPTDSAPRGQGPDGGWLTATLAILGLVMIAGTIIVDQMMQRRN